MSRIGKKPISIPDGVNIDIDGSKVTVKGSKGTLERIIDADFGLKIEDGELSVSRPSEQKKHKALHGLYRSLIQNMVVGVTDGYKKELQLIGVGYKAVVKGSVLEMSLGYSHEIFFVCPQELKVTANTEKGKAPVVTIEGIDKELVGEVAAKIKGIRKVEPYKGKGIRFLGEEVRRKAGKQAAK